MTVVVAFICEASVLADLCRKLGRKERLAGVCVVCVDSRGKAGVYIQRESVDGLSRGGVETESQASTCAKCAERESCAGEAENGER